MAKAPNKNQMGNYVFTDYEFLCYKWCVENNIKISPKAVTANKENSKWDIIIEINTKTKQSPVSYGPIDIWKKIAELYKFYYEKFTNQDIKTVVVKEEIIKKEKPTQIQSTLEF